MKIIETGIPPLERTFRFNCVTCGTKFEEVGKECDKLDFDANGVIAKCTCPVCSHLVTYDSAGRRIKLNKEFRSFTFGHKIDLYKLNANNGDLFYDINSNKIYVYMGYQWKSMEQTINSRYNYVS